MTRRAPGTKRMGIAALASLLLHAAALGVGLGVLRHRAPVADADKQASVELLMVEQKGSGPPVPGAPSAPQPPPAAAAPPAPETPKSPPAPAQGGAAQSQPQLPEASEPAEPPPLPPAQPTATASPPPPKAPLEFNLAGTDSKSGAMSSGPGIVPASIDDTARGKPPIYPPEAARRGQQGEVVLVIHIGANGLPLGTDVLESSGVASLDESAQDAVMLWHFTPATKDGTPVPSDMQMRFDFTLN